MATVGPMEYARKYWNLEVPIINDDNEIVRYEKVRFAKYRLYQGWDPKKSGGPPPGHKEFVNAVNTYASGLFKKGKRLELQVKNIWGNVHFLSPDSLQDLVFKRLLWRSVLAFSGKGSPEDVQITLQLAVRCGLAKELQQYCDEIIDKPYPRLGLDCNGFVGNYLCYKDSENAWNPFALERPKHEIHGETGIKTMCEKLAAQPVKYVANMLPARIHVLGMVNNNGTVIDGGFGEVGHVMITDAHYLGFQAASPPIPKEYVGKQCLVYSGVEATPAVGLSEFNYTILDIEKNGVATVWRDKVASSIKVKMYPVP